MVQDNLLIVTLAKYKTLEAQKEIKWNAVTRSWTPRNPDLEWGVIFNSSNDPLADEPADPNIKVGDQWVKHPDAP